MKTIVYRDWMKGSGSSRERSEAILARFDLGELKRGKRAPGRARRLSKKRPRTQH